MKNKILILLIFLISGCSSIPKSDQKESIDTLFQKPQINYKTNTLPKVIKLYYLENNDNYRLYELITCCKELFRHLQELKKHPYKAYTVLQKYNCNDLKILTRIINTNNLRDLTPDVLYFLEKKTTLVGNMAPDIKTCLAKYIKYILIYCSKIPI